MTRRPLLLTPALLLLTLFVSAAGACEEECSYDTDCDAGQLCVENACVEFPHDFVAAPAQGTCDSDVECSKGELCFNRTCTDESLVPNPLYCPAPPLSDELTCTSWNESDCPCYAGIVAFREKEIDGRPSCGGIARALGLEVKMKQNGCSMEAVGGQILRGEAVGYGELRLRLEGFENETPCSTSPDRWEDSEAVRLTCSQSCQLWMERLPAPPPERIVPDGDFLMGTPDAEAISIDKTDELPEHLVSITCFYMDRFEVSRGDYFTCMSRQACDAPTLPSSITLEQFFSESNKLLPMTYVPHRAAEKYCQYAGKQLPTEAEWERAARASRWAMSDYPWGRETVSVLEDCSRANFAVCGGQPLPVSAGGASVREAGASYFDIVDLAGNVREWTRDRYRPTAYAEVAATGGSLGARNPEIRTPSEALGNVRVVRGGSFKTEVPPPALPGDPPRDALRASARDYEDEQSALDDLGFRCVRYKVGQER